MCGLLWQLSHKEYACNAGDAGDTDSIFGSGRSPGGGYGNPFQYSCLANAMDRESSIVHRFAELDTTGVVWHTCMHVVNV